MRDSDRTPGAQYREGVDAVVAIAERIDADGWARPACGRWSGLETARHLVAVTGWYHEWLDRAEGGLADPPFPAVELADRNEAALADLDDLGPEEAVDLFRERALGYLGRAAARPDLAFGFPYGTVTVGLHLGVAAAEWHIHAWDLSASTLPRHRPSDPGALFASAGRCWAAARGGLGGAVLGRLVPLGARASPWDALLRRSGRTGH